MNSLFKAIRDHYEGDTGAGGLVSLLNGRFWLSEAMQRDPKYPYVVYYLISLNSLDAFDHDERVEMARIQFSIFDSNPSPERVGTVYEALRSRFDRASLTYSGGDFTNVGCVREISNLIRERDDVWHYFVYYIIYLQPT